MVYVWFVLLLISSKYVLFVCFFESKKHHWGPHCISNLDDLCRWHLKDVLLLSCFASRVFRGTGRRRACYVENEAPKQPWHPWMSRENDGNMVIHQMIFGGPEKPLGDPIHHDKPWGPIGPQSSPKIHRKDGMVTDRGSSGETPDLERRTRSEQLVTNHLDMSGSRQLESGLCAVPDLRCEEGRFESC